MIADFDADGNIVDLEILDASERVTEPQNMVFESLGHPIISDKVGRGHFDAGEG